VWNETNPGEVWEENEFWIELSWRIDPDGSLGIRSRHESREHPGEKLGVDEYYRAFEIRSGIGPGLRPGGTGGGATRRGGRPVRASVRPHPCRAHPRTADNHSGGTCPLIPSYALRPQRPAPRPGDIPAPTGADGDEALDSGEDNGVYVFYIRKTDNE
jgi:hypothetical protein